MSQRSYTLAEISNLLGAEVHGDSNCVITSIATLEQAQPGQIAFLDNTRYRKYLPHTKASAVILKSTFLQECPSNALVLDNPYLGFAKIAALFEKRSKPAPGIHPTAVIAAGCRIDSTASIGPHCVIEAGVSIDANAIIGSGCVIGERVHIGEQTWLWPNVTLYHDVQIGKRVIAHSGVVIGSDGFGIANDKGIWQKVPQLGSVTIGDDVEIGANTTIDRGALNDTVIETGVKLDNQIQVGHNVHIGAHTAIAGGVMIAGSARIGKYCMIGGGSGINGHIEITDKVVITGMSRVSHSIHEAGMYSSGSPLQPYKAWLKNSVHTRQLDALTDKVKQLEKMLSNHSSRD